MLARSQAPTLTPATARRLALTRQRLAGPRPSPDAYGLMDIMRDLGCVQIDPISVVVRTHLLVLRSRLGNYDPRHLDALLWEERKLFEYWAHCASIVLSEDYPLHNLFMGRYATGVPRRPVAKRYRDWLEANAGLRRQILARLRRDGPLASRHFEYEADANWRSTGWTSGRNVSQMLDHLWTKGQIMVAGRVGGQKLWDVAERCLPAWTPRERLTEGEVVRGAAQRSLRALGVATARHIAQHFIRGRYPDLDKILAGLESQGRIARVEIRDKTGASAWPEVWYIHADDLPLLDRLAGEGWEGAGRTTLLSPFDNLICDRQRTERLFNFKFTIEIYVPRAKRQYGYYVLPILHGDQLIGRLDPVMDRAKGRLVVNAVYAEPDAPASRACGAAVAGAVEELAEFLQAREIVYNSRRMPAAWKRALIA